MDKYQFELPPNTACISCKHVIQEQKDVLYVSHDSDDGTWQFLCGKEAHTAEEGAVVGLGTITNYDPTLNRIADMPLGVCGERQSINHDWQFFRIPIHAPE